MRILRLPLITCCWMFLSHAQSAGDMATACKQITTSRVNERITILPRDFDAGVCWGAFAALEQLRENTTKTGQSAADFCMPENTTRARMIAAFTEYVKSHAERSDEKFYPMAREALRTAFPCRGSSPRSKP